MTLPELTDPYTQTAVTEQSETYRNADPGDVQSRVFNIEKGPLDKSPILTDWVQKLIRAEFNTVTVTSVVTDVLYKDQSYADWQITIEYIDPETSVYAVPINDLTGEIRVEAVSKEQALQTAREKFNQDITATRDRASLSLTVSVPDSIENVSIVDSSSNTQDEIDADTLN